MKNILLLVAIPIALAAQTTINGTRVIKGTWDASGAASTLPNRTGAGSPAGRDACEQGETFFQTDAAPGQNVWLCTATGSPGTWSQVNGTGVSVPSVFGRTGNITAQSGDYNAAQVTHAADTTAANTFSQAQMLAGGASLGSQALTASYANDGATGTSLNQTVKLTGAPSRAVRAGTLDSAGLVGVCISGCGTASSAEVAIRGSAACAFDGATVAGDYVQNSRTAAGNCHDAGATYPASGQVLGRVLSTNASGGTYQVQLFGPEIQAGLTAASAQANRLWYCNSTNGTTAYTCSLNASSVLTAYTTGMWLTLVADTTNNGAATLNVDNVGVKNIRQSDGATAPAAGQIVAGRAVTVTYDGTVWRLPPYSGVPFSATADQFVTAIDGGGVASKAQPSFSNLLGSVAASQMPAMTGDATSNAGTVLLSLASGVNANPGTCGDATHICAVTSNTKGLITNAAPAAITPAGIGAEATTNKNSNGGYVGRDANGNAGVPGTLTGSGLAASDGVHTGGVTLLPGSSSSFADAIPAGTMRLFLDSANGNKLTRRDSGGNNTVVEGVSDVAADTTPQLGGDLDMNSHSIQTVTSAEMARLHGVTSGVQSQLDGKASTSHIHAGVYEPVDSTILRQGNLAGSGAALTPAHSDHNHTGTYAPGVHASAHQNGGGDEVATASAAASAIPKAGASGKLDIGWIPTGSTSSTVTVGNDARLNDARTPVAHAASHKSGGSDEVAAAAPAANAIPKAGAGAKLDIGWLPTGQTGTTVPLGNDARFNDARTPTAHAATHQNGGADEIATATPGANAIPKTGSGGKLAIGWVASGTPDGTKFVRDDGTLATPAGASHTQNTDSGTTQTVWQLDSGSAGPKLKNSGGTLEIRNAGDTAYAAIHASQVQSGDGTTAGSVTMNELAANGPNFRKWLVPDLLTASLTMTFPDTVPAAGDMLIFGAPSAGVSTMSFGKPYNQTVANGGAPLTQRPTINFVGTGINCADNAGASRTDCTVSGGGGGGGAPPDAHYVTTQAEAGLSAESNLGALATGLVKITVAGGVATPSTATPSPGDAAGDYVGPADSRLSNARTPTPHAASHGSGQSDPITPAAIGAAPAQSGTGALVVVSGTVQKAIGTAADCLHVDGSSAACGAGAGAAVGRKQVSVTFTSIADGTCQQQAATWSGITTADTLIPGWPSSLGPGLFGGVLVSAADTVAVRLCNLSGAPITPGAVSLNLTTAVYNLSGSGPIDFASIPDGSCAVSSFALTGAAAGDPVTPKWPASLEAGLFGSMVATTANTIQVRLCNLSGATVDPASATFGASIAK